MLTNDQKFILRQDIASMLDHPSVYMGGPSWGSKQKAIKIINHLEKNYNIDSIEDDSKCIELVKSWRNNVSWDELDDK